MSGSRIGHLGISPSKPAHWMMMRGRNIIQINTSITESFRDKGNSSDLCIQRQMPKQFDSDAADKRGAEG